MQCHAMPCHAIPCHAIPYNTIQYNTIQYTIYIEHEHTLREESNQTNILQYKLPAAILSAVCSVIQNVVLCTFILLVII